jgi:hypothetical protein
MEASMSSFLRLVAFAFLLLLPALALAQENDEFASMSKYTRAIVGIDLSAASSQATKSDAFVEFNLMASTGKSRINWVWVNPRIAAVPQQTSNLLTTVTSSSPSFNSLLNTQFNQLVQSFDVLAGTDVDFWKARIPGDATGQDTAITVAFSVSAGFSTPLSVQSQNVQQFSVPNTLTNTQLQQIFGSNIPTICAAATSTNCINTVAFVPPDRSRFFKQYYAGFRLKSFYYGDATDGNNNWSGLCTDNSNQPIERACGIFPGTVDVGFGQNSAISGGNLHGWVLRTEVFYPLWFNPAFHLFFTGWLHLDRHHELASQLPVVLDPATGTINPSQVQSVPLGTVNRDFYRIGAGVDLLALYNHYHTAPKK